MIPSNPRQCAAPSIRRCFRPPTSRGCTRQRAAAVDQLSAPGPRNHLASTAYVPGIYCRVGRNPACDVHVLDAACISAKEEHRMIRSVLDLQGGIYRVHEAEEDNCPEGEVPEDCGNGERDRDLEDRARPPARLGPLRFRLLVASGFLSPQVSKRMSRPLGSLWATCDLVTATRRPRFQLPGSA